MLLESLTIPSRLTTTIFHLFYCIYCLIVTNDFVFAFISFSKFRSTYGDIEVDVEEGKKENRSQGVWSMRLADYIDLYEKKDVYMVHSVPPKMAGKFKGVLPGFLIFSQKFKIS